MKHLLLALFFVTFLGWQPDLTSACNMIAEQCIKTSINCREAEQCFADAGLCARTDYCFLTTKSCENTTNAIGNCLLPQNCQPPYNFGKLIKDMCIYNPVTMVTTAGVAALTGFATMTVCFLTHFFIE